MLVAASIPTVDIAAFREGPVPGDADFPSPAQLAVAHQVDTALRGDAFLYLTNLGVMPSQMANMYRLSEKIFQQPTETKIQNLAPMEHASNTGYVRAGEEQLNPYRNEPDLKELLNFNFSPTLVQDFRGCPSDFATTAQNFWTVLCNAAHTFAIICAVALNLPPDHFNNMLSDTRGIISRLLHYPRLSDADADKQAKDPMAAIRASEHTDFGFFTFLFTRSPGLQARFVAGDTVGQHMHEGDWLDIPVPADPTTAIVNIGGLMARCTNDIWCATAHRVVANSDMANQSRYSIAHFTEPSGDVLIDAHPNLIEQGAVRRFEPILAGKYILARLKAAQQNIS